MTDFLRHEGKAVYVRGYVAPYNSLSIPLDFNGGQCELIRTGAFDDVLRHPSASLNVQLHHMGANFIIGSIAQQTLKFWSDEYGLAYECGPFAINAKHAGAITSIVRGGVRGCSWLGTFAEVATETLAGERVQVIRRFQHLSHIAPCSGGAYPGAATWCSHEHVDDLPEHLKPLARHWLDNRPAARSMTKPMARKPALARAVTPRPQARAKQRPSIPLAVADIYPAIPGFSSEEFEVAALQEAHDRRMHKEAKAGQYALQRERNRWRRFAGRAA